MHLLLRLLSAALFLAPQIALASTPGHCYLVIRYDDYAPVAPYEGPPRQIETERRLFDLAAKHHARIVVGVIPFPISDNAAPALDPAKTTISQSWLADAGNPWVLLLRDGIERGIIEPALHGFEHRRRSQPGFRPGEYRRQPIDWQLETLRLGRSALQTAINQPVRIFIPPWNGWDASTVRALQRLDFEWLSPDLHYSELDAPQLRIAPQSTADPVEAWRTMQKPDTPPGSVIVLVTHPFDFEKPGGSGEDYFQALEKVMAFADESSDWTSVGFLNLPARSPGEWASRFQAAVAWNRNFERLGELAVKPFTAASPTPFYPLDWYHAHTGVLRLTVAACILAALLAGSFLACVLWRVIRFSAKGLGANDLARRLVLVGFILSLLATAYLAWGAWQIARHDYAIRMVRWLAIAAATGTTLGLSFALARNSRQFKQAVDAQLDDSTIHRTIPA